MFLLKVLTFLHLLENGYHGEKGQCYLFTECSCIGFCHVQYVKTNTMLWNYETIPWKCNKMLILIIISFITNNSKIYF